MNDSRHVGVAEVEHIGARRIEEGGGQPSPRSRRPITVAWRPAENVASDRSMVSIAIWWQPLNATAKKFINERMAACTTGGASASHRVSAINCASLSVTSEFSDISPK